MAREVLEFDPAAAREMAGSFAAAAGQLLQAAQWFDATNGGAYAAFGEVGPLAGTRPAYLDAAHVAARDVGHLLRCLMAACDNLEQTVANYTGSDLASILPGARGPAEPPAQPGPLRPPASLPAGLQATPPPPPLWQLLQP